MRVQVNGETRELAERATVKDVLAALGLAEQVVAVERNEVIVPRAEHATTLLAEGDRLEVVQFVGGG